MEVLFRLAFAAIPCDDRHTAATQFRKAFDTSWWATILHNGVDYEELGGDYLDILQPRRLPHFLVQRLESLGPADTLHSLDQTA